MRIDALAISLSGLCLVHCLALPILAVSMPILGPISGNEWLHQALVIAALPIVLFAYSRTSNPVTRNVFLFVAAAGASLLVAGAFVEALHDHETLLTVSGAALLIGAHIFRWQGHQA